MASVYGGERDESPKMQEVKFNYQNLTAEVSREKVLIKNKNLFVNSNQFDCVVLLEKDGKFLQQAVLVTDVEPLSEEEYELPVQIPDTPGEYAVTVSFRLREETDWAPKGYEVAFGQGVFENGKEPQPVTDEITVIKGKWNIGIRGINFECMFSDLKSGIVMAEES